MVERVSEFSVLASKNIENESNDISEEDVLKVLIVSCFSKKEAN